ncbi:MAG: hypothetical protein AB4426_14085 [Xenococcaceae cyanobacterium]
MARVNILKSLLILTIMLVFSGGCQIQNGIVSRRHEADYITTAQKQVKSSQELAHSLNELDTSYKQFKTSLEKFLVALEKIANEEISQKDVNFKTPNEKLAQLSQAIDKFQKNLQTANRQLQMAVGVIPSEIDNTIQSIEKVIQPLSNGLSIKTVYPAEESLAEESLPIIIDGSFDRETQQAIDVFLNQKIQDLEYQIYRLTQELQKQGIEITIDSIKDSILLIVFIVSIIAIAAIFTLVLYLDKKLNLVRRFSKNTNKKKKKANNLTKLFEQISLDEIHKIIEEEYQNINLNQNEIISSLKLAIEHSLKEILNKSNLRELPAISLSLKDQLQKSVNKPPIKRKHKTLITPYDELVDTYNTNPNTLSKNAIKVSETEESINQHNRGGRQATALGKDSKGNYWILTVKNFKYLVPKYNIKINKYNCKPIQALFICFGYQPEYSKKFKLLKPAVVSPGDQEEQWELKEQGVLQFED